MNAANGSRFFEVVKIKSSVRHRRNRGTTHQAVRSAWTKSQTGDAAEERSMLVVRVNDGTRAL